MEERIDFTWLVTSQVDMDVKGLQQINTCYEDAAVPKQEYFGPTYTSVYGYSGSKGCLGFRGLGFVSV